MAWVSLILNCLLKPKESATYCISQILGYMFILVGGVLALIFLFQLLSPLLGYLATGALFCAFFFSVGGAFLVIGQKKKPRLIDDMFEEAQEMLKTLEFAKTIKQNGLKILIFAFVTGLLLSQIKLCHKEDECKDK